MKTKGRSSPKRNPAFPPFLRPFFWDVDFCSLQWNRDRRFIVSRILSKGDDAAIRWMRKVVGERSLRTYVREGLRVLSPRQDRYWRLVLGLSPRKRRMREGNAAWAGRLNP